MRIDEHQVAVSKALLICLAEWAICSRDHGKTTVSKVASSARRGVGRHLQLRRRQVGADGGATRYGN